MVQAADDEDGGLAGTGLALKYQIFTINHRFDTERLGLRRGCKAITINTTKEILIEA